eukprot:4462806-Pleurochrysis_carterae.AAC.3
MKEIQTSYAAYLLKWASVSSHDGRCSYARHFSMVAAALWLGSTACCAGRALAAATAESQASFIRGPPHLFDRTDKTAVHTNHCWSGKYTLSIGAEQSRSPPLKLSAEAALESTCTLFDAPNKQPPHDPDAGRAACTVVAKPQGRRSVPEDWAREREESGRVWTDRDPYRRRARDEQPLQCRRLHRRWPAARALLTRGARFLLPLRSPL